MTDKTRRNEIWFMCFLAGMLAGITIALLLGPTDMRTVQIMHVYPALCGGTK